ncbi:MAG: hypothetical protein HYV63_12630 [Candidatus Schekmanbacteria bacterium]|nr:hypothetical protein [Candidatus Schekmanbacteria bacterium]
MKLDMLAELSSYTVEKIRVTGKEVELRKFCQSVYPTSPGCDVIGSTYEKEEKYPGRMVFEEIV